MDKLYTPAPDGLCGDEDNGQTSAWYVFSALGMYPVAPGTGQYVLGSPLFEKAVLTLENGKTFVINAPENSKDKVYVAKAALNNGEYTRNYLLHSDMVKGGVLDLKMSPVPNTSRGIRKEDFPYSMTNEWKP
jgi:putative alpha-1,2-mannosidase